MMVRNGCLFTIIVVWKRRKNSMKFNFKKAKLASLVIALALCFFAGNSYPMIKPTIVKLFETMIDSFSSSSSSPHYPNLAISSVKVLPNGRLGIGIKRDSKGNKDIVGHVNLTIPFDTFYKRTTISIYRFDHTKQRFALWEKHSLAQLDPMKTQIPHFYQNPNCNYSFQTEKTFQGTDTFGIILESPQPESRHDDNHKLVELTSTTHKRQKKQADLVITSVSMKNVGRYCYPKVRIENRGGEVSDKAWQGKGAVLALYYRSLPTQSWQTFVKVKFSEFDPGKRLKKRGGTITYTCDKAIDQTYRFKVVIDDDNNILESNETNNKKELYLACNAHAIPGSRPPVLPKGKSKPAPGKIPTTKTPPAQRVPSKTIPIHRY